VFSVDLEQNEFVARTLEEVAHARDAEGANEHRVQAYRRAAQTIRELTQPVSELIAAEGKAGLLRLSGIGKGLAETIFALVQTGRLPDSKGLNPRRPMAANDE
jgi:DNA polymerase/3'-5' exonuclease PolX